MNMTIPHVRDLNNNVQQFLFKKLPFIPRCKHSNCSTRTQESPGASLLHVVETI